MVEPLSVDQVRAQFPEMVDRLTSAYGYVPNSMLTMAWRPELLSGFSQLASTVLGEYSSIPAELRWMIAHMASRASGCRYCQAHTGHNAAEVAGLKLEKFDELWNFESSVHFSSAERSALRVAVGGGSVPNGVTSEMFSDLEVHYSTGQIVDIVAVVALFGFLNRWNDTMATAIEDHPEKFADEHLSAQIGWEAEKHRRF